MSRLFQPLEVYHETRANKEAKAAGWGQIKVLKKSWPDRLYFRNGRCAWVEYKRAGKDPRPDQLAVHRMLRSRGEVVFVIDDWRDLVPALDRIVWPD